QARSAVDDAAYALVEHYRRAGFVQCTVDYELAESSTGRRTAVFTVREGPRTRLAAVRIEGCSQLRASEALGAIDLAGLERSSVARWYVERDLADAARSLEAHAASKGHLDARVVDTAVEFDAERTSARVVFRLDEGPRYTVASDIAIEGGIPSIDAQLDLGSWPGRPLTPRLPLDLRARIEEHYQQRGRPDVEVDLREGASDAQGRVPLAFVVVPGPEVTIEGIVVRGNHKTRSSHVLDLVTIRSGERYDVRAVRATFSRLNRSGLFRRVSVGLEPGAQPQRRLVIEVDEATSTEVFFEPGYGSYEGLRALAGVRETNLFGAGRTLSLDGLLAERARRAVLGLSEPHVFGTDFEAGVSVFRELRDEPSYDKDEFGAAFTLSRELRPRLRISTEYRLRASRVSDVDVTDPLALAQTENVDISTLSLVGSWDRRDSIFVPTQGNLLRASIEYGDAALGSELDFTRLRLTETWLASPADGTVLALSWRMGVIAPHGSTDGIPLQERFFNGGENTVRSFREDELGPSDASGTPIGGEGFQVFTAELRQRVKGALEGALFWDVGTLASQAQDVLDWRGSRSALGVGARYMLPIGPLRLDWGWNPDARVDEDRWRAHFSVGMAF
ncbi:MAG: hypothetical protein FJ298_15000, partial [Planctomycetes bacterium]|nr:hypothetical protein [Planctomycetota bacterium]